MKPWNLYISISFTCNDKKNEIHVNNVTGNLKTGQQKQKVFQTEFLKASSHWQKPFTAMQVDGQQSIYILANFNPLLMFHEHFTQHHLPKSIISSLTMIFDSIRLCWIIRKNATSGWTTQHAHNTISRVYCPIFLIVFPSSTCHKLKNTTN